MAGADTEQVEVNSPATANIRGNDNAAAGNGAENGGGGGLPFPSLGRQSSIYSLTLDEFQNTMCESGKNFGSMNMDEFLNSIWTAEENQNQVNHHQQQHPAQPQHDAVSTVAQTMAIVNPQSAAPVAGGRGLGLAKQPSLARQGSLTLPAPLCRKTVDEVWSEIQRGGRGGGSSGSGQNQSTGPSTGPVQQRQQTFGEMTLEDFLIKAGVVRDAGLAPPPPLPPAAAAAVGRHQQQQPPPPPAAPAQYGMYQNGNNPQMGHTYGPTPVPVMTVPGGFPALPQNGSAAAGPVGGESSAYVSGGPPGMDKRNNGYVPVGPTGAVCYGGAGGGYGAGLGITSPVSPLGPEGLVDGSGGQYGMDVGGLRARKRTLDGPVEKVVERRQRRMIKNRESAARSRARKQAYTVELEAELNQLREENSQLKQALAELERQRSQQYVEEQQNVAKSRAQKVEDRLRMMQRSKSCPLLEEKWHHQECTG
ncbi:hypothetical protein V2J09_018656 [Rumex salicifolius]